MAILKIKHEDNQFISVPNIHHFVAMIDIDMDDAYAFHIDGKDLPWTKEEIANMVPISVRYSMGDRYYRDWYTARMSIDVWDTTAGQYKILFQPIGFTSTTIEYSTHVEVDVFYIWKDEYPADYYVGCQLSHQHSGGSN